VALIQQMWYFWEYASQP